MSRDLSDRLLVLEIHLVHIPPFLQLGGSLFIRLRVVLRLLAGLFRRDQCSPGLGLLPDPRPEARLVGDLLRDDIHRSRNSLIGVLHLFFLVDIAGRLPADIASRLQGQNIVRKALQPFLFGYTCAGPSLGAVGKIQVLPLHQRLRRFDGRLQLCCEFPLRFYALHDLGFALLEGTQIGQGLSQFPELFVCECSRCFFPVSGNERDRVSLVDELYSCLHLPVLYTQFQGNRFNDLHSVFCSFND